MKNSKSVYVIAICVAGLLVAFSIVMPGILLNKTEATVVGSSSTVNNGGASSQQQNSTLRTPLTPTASSIKKFITNALAFEDSGKTSILSTESSNGSMNIKEATNTCIKQMTSLLQKGAFPALAGFPTGYSVSAELRTILNKNKNPLLQYWSISFASPDDNSTDITVSLDDQTGLFLAIFINEENAPEMSVEKSTETIAQSMHLPGKLLSLKKQHYSAYEVVNRTIWAVDNSVLFMQVVLAQTPKSIYFSMDFSNSQTIKDNG